MATIAEMAGDCLMIGYRGAEERAPRSVLEAFRAGEVCGVNLLRRNIDSPEQFCAMVGSIHEAAAAVRVPLVCVDQEGGRVRRLRAPFLELPPMRRIAERLTPREASRLSEAVADELRAIGVTVNFAPVADVDTNPANPIIGDRAFSDDPQRVARYAGAWALGHTIAGVLACAKHFPGHGDTELDSHLALPTLAHPMSRLHAVELYPFRRLARAQIPLMMTAHVVVSALDPERPATLSRAVIGQILREAIGYEGVVVTDCLEMRAVADHFSIEATVESALAAGVDVLLFSHSEEKWRAAREAMIRLCEKSEALRAQLEAASGRVRRLERASLGAPGSRAPLPDWRARLGSSREALELIARLGEAEAARDPTDVEP